MSNVVSIVTGDHSFVLVKPYDVHAHFDRWLADARDWVDDDPLDISKPKKEG